MGLVEELTEVLPVLRVEAESLMLDTCSITRPKSGTTLDPTTGLPTRTFDTIYTGRCKVQNADLQVNDPKSGDRIYSVQSLTLHVPVSVTGIAVGDTITITASVMDPAQIGRKFTVSGKFHKTFATAQRIPVEEVV